VVLERCSWPPSFLRYSDLHDPYHHWGIVGVGAAREVAAVRWNVASNVVTAWILTMPAAALMGAAFYQVCKVWPWGGQEVPETVQPLGFANALSTDRRRLVASPS
jgi:hypothetical protein